MAYGVALSRHPVSSLATGEVVGQLLEAVGADADLIVVLATPGHRGALDDIAAAVRRLLSPAVLLAAVTTGLGAGDDIVERGPGLAAWSGRCGPVATIGAGTDPRPSFDPVGALILGRAATQHPLAARPGDPLLAPGVPLLSPGVPILSPGVPILAPGVPILAGDLAGPVLLDGAAAGPGPVGVIFGPRSGLALTEAHGVRPLGPVMVVTSAAGAMVHELDGQPAWRRLTDVARDGMPAPDLATLGTRLHLRVTTSGPGRSPDGPSGPADPAGPCPGPIPVLGVDRANGALALRDPVATGATVQFAMTDVTTVRAAVGRALGPGSAGALILAPAGGAHLLGTGPAETLPDLWSEGDVGTGAHLADVPLVDGGPPLPAATLICETAPPATAAAVRSTVGPARMQVASFSPPRRPG